MNNGLTDTQKNIFEKVRAYRDVIIAGKVEKPVLEVSHQCKHRLVQK